MTARFAILAYPGVEPIDIGASFGVFSMAKRIVPGLSFQVIAKEREVEMANGLTILAQGGLDRVPEADCLIVLGGPGWVEVAEDRQTLDFLRAARARGRTLAAICTGGMILAAAGLLEGRRATTKSEIVAGETSPLALLGERPGIEALPARIVDTGEIVTGGGVSLGIDMTLYLLGRFCGEEARAETARILEYAAAWQANAARLPDLVAIPQAIAAPSSAK
ncbi:MAG: DJ-1/PfpI family protein [Pseudomonadota bacterium]